MISKNVTINYKNRKIKIWNTKHLIKILKQNVVIVLLLNGQTCIKYQVKVLPVKCLNINIKNWQNNTTLEIKRIFKFKKRCTIILNKNKTIKFYFKEFNKFNVKNEKNWKVYNIKDIIHILIIIIISITILYTNIETMEEFYKK